MDKKIALVFMVAGISKRFGGKIKGFAAIGPKGESLIECSLNQALKNKFTRIIFVVGKKTEQAFKDKFGDSYKKVPIDYVLQDYDETKRDKPWGTGDALCSIKEIIKEPFIVCSGDDLYGEKSFQILFKHLTDNYDNNIEGTIGFKLGLMLADSGTVNRGIFDVKNGFVQKLIENLGLTKENLKEKGLKEDDLCSMGIFALHPETVFRLSKNAEMFKKKNVDNRTIEFFLPDELSNLIKSNEMKMKIYPSSDKWLGITYPGDEEIVRKELSKK